MPGRMAQIKIVDYYERVVEDKKDIENLRLIANTKLEQLSTDSQAQLIVYPPRVGDNYDGVEDKFIITLRETSGKARIKAEDLLGFIGVGDTLLTIGTRFTGNFTKKTAEKEDKEEKTEEKKEEKEDFLLHYMLQKVLKINIFSLPHPVVGDAVLDLLIYMFPGMLSKALRQGMLKRYVKFEKNDANVKGPININRHIRYNYPFNGKIAYTQREHTANNPATQLIRHTIEYIRTTMHKHLLNNTPEIRGDVATIVTATPTYDRKCRASVVNANKRRNPHPYYTAYEPLLKLCIDILEHRKIRYSSSDKLIHGILFSGSWLWEEYLYNAIFSKLNFTHPDNHRKTDAIHVFKLTVDTETSEESEEIGARRFPDYMFKDTESGEVKMVVDAKYRRFDNCGDRDNLHQLVTYMHITQSESGALICPIETDIDAVEKKKIKDKSRKFRVLQGYGGKYYKIGFEIPENADSFGDFASKMAEEEDRLILYFNEKLKSRTSC